METLGFELSKRLNDLGLLDNIETEYGFYINPDNYKKVVSYNNSLNIKTLTLEESISFLGDKHFIQIAGGGFSKNNYDICIILNNNNIKGEGKTILKAIEEILEYLIDNKLIWKK